MTYYKFNESSLRSVEEELPDLIFTAYLYSVEIADFTSITQNILEGV